MLKRCFENLATHFLLSHRTTFRENSVGRSVAVTFPNVFTGKDFQRYHVAMTICDVIDGRLLPWKEARARKISRDYLLQELPGLKEFLKTFLTDKVSHQCLAFFFFFFFLFFSPLKKNRKRNTGSLIFSVKETVQKTDSQKELLSNSSGHVLIV